jgi:hypothetical protein
MVAFDQCNAIKMIDPEYQLGEDYEIVKGMKNTEKMKIIHSTHEAATGGRSTRRPNSATQRIKDYFSIRIHGPSLPKGDDEEALIQPDPKIGERRASETKVGNEPGLCAFLIKEHKELKRKQREKKMLDASRVRIDKANKKASGQSGNKKSGEKSAGVKKAGYGSLQEVSFPIEEMSAPTLRRIKSLGNLKEAKIQADTRAKAQGDEYLNRLRAQRQAISEGNLEKVIPPSSSPPKLKLTPKRQNSSPVKNAHTKSSSTSSKLTSYMGTSADLLDATRRDLTSNLRKSAEKAEKALSSKFDHLGRYSSGHGNDWEDDSDSDESFYCIGERRLSELDKARRISDNGTDPWTDGCQEECRLCRKPSPAGVRGLCRECENEFRRPKTTVLVDSEDEVKPPPPLKIKKTKTASANTQVTVGIHNPFLDENVVASKINQVDKKPQLVTPDSHISQQVYIDDGSNTPESGTEFVSRYQRWQSPDLRAQYLSQENESSRWSPRLLDDDIVSPPLPSLRSKFNKARNLPKLDGDMTPLVIQDDKQSNKTRRTNGAKRNESFYGHWDEVMKEDEARGASLAKRDNRYQKL